MSGQERFWSIGRDCCRNTDIIWFIVDLTDIHIEEIESRINEIEKISKDTASLVIVGTKKDLYSLYSIPTMRSKIKQFADEHCFPYIETSALTGEGVEELLEITFMQLDKKVLEEIEDEEVYTEEEFIEKVGTEKVSEMEIEKHLPDSSWSINS